MLLRISYPVSSHYPEFVLSVCEVGDWSLLWMRTYVPQRTLAVSLFSKWNFSIPYWFKQRVL
jgi:hypothetical protein